MTRSSSITIAFLAVLLCAHCMSSAACADQPNIIYILADDLGYGDLASYGQERIASPNLDRMAAQGIRFTQHYAGSTVCAPSRCSLMTGLHSGHTFIRGNKRMDLRPGDITIAEVLRDAGYATALIGKWGLGTEGGEGVPTRQGFDHFFGYLDQAHAHNHYPEYLMRGEARVALKNEVPDNPRWNKGQGKATKKVEYSHDLFIRDAMRWIEEQREGPFFLYLALTIPHANNEAGRAGMEVPDLGPYGDTDWPDPEKGFAGMLHRMDRDVGRILDRLDELGIDQDTVVVFTSDNGPHQEGGHKAGFFDSSGPLRGTKRDLYEGGVRVPMIVRWPGSVPGGTTTDHVSAFWDTFATLAELASANAPKTDGISFAPTILGNRADQQDHDYLYWEFFEQGGKQAIRFGDYKAIRLKARENPDGPLELYDISTDLAEQNNLADELPDVVARAHEIISSARTESEHFQFQ